MSRPVWNRNAEIEEVEFHGPTGDIKGLALRLYNPQSRQWNINWANAKDATLGAPTIGSFKNGRGEFYDQETYKGRTILVPLHLDRDHHQFAALRAVVFGGRGEDVGSELDYGSGEGVAGHGESQQVNKSGLTHLALAVSCD